MFKPLVVAGALIAAHVLAACSAVVHRESPWAAGCARAEADMRFAALDAGSFVGVTTRKDMIVAEKRWVALGPEKVAADKAVRKATFTGPVTSLKVVPFPAPVARQMHQIDADLAAFGAASVGYRPHKSPRAIGDTAQKLMRDIRAVLATCSPFRAPKVGLGLPRPLARAGTVAAAGAQEWLPVMISTLPG